MEGEIKNLIAVWAIALVCLLYCHKIDTNTNTNNKNKRLIAFIPVFCIFIYLPSLLTSVHFSGTISFFITWLANFKLLLLAFDKGPLYSSKPLPLSKFILTACLPIKISSSSPANGKKKSMVMNYWVKFIVFVVLLKVYEYGDGFHPVIKMGLFCVHIYVVLDVGLAFVAYMARSILGLELEPQFNEPYMATSLQDFWGKRWNLMVTGILHPTVYLPVRSCFKNKNNMGGPLAAVMATFMVSGLMHELIFYYIGRLKPTWEVTCFFLIHGVLLCVELVLKRSVVRYRMPGVISGALALSVVMATSFWLFFPPFLRCDTEVRSCKEFVAFLEFVTRGRFVASNDVSCPYFSTN